MLDEYNINSTVQLDVRGQHLSEQEIDAIERVHPTVPCELGGEAARDFKLTCIPTLLAAPPPKQYSTPTLMPPATKADPTASVKDCGNQ